MVRSAVLFAALALAALAGAGCSTYAQRTAEIRSQFYVDNLVGARQTIEKASKRHRREADVLALDHAVIELADGQPKQAERLLREVRDHFDYLEQKSVGEMALVMASDDTHQGYAGEDYEKVLIRAMLAVSNLMTDGGDAGAYALQMGEKQQQIIEAGADKNGENPKLAYQRVAVGPYINSLLREQTHTNYDDVARSSEIVCSWQPSFVYGKQDLERALHGRHSMPGNGVLYVFTFVGHGPFKEEAVEVPSTAALLVASLILSNNSKYGLPPNIVPVKVPRVIVPSNTVSDVRVTVDGQPAGSTATITDVGQLAVQQYEAVYPRVIARAVVRRVVKNGVVYGAEAALGQQRGSPVNLLLQLGGLAWQAAESADTRCWGLLPAQIQVLRIELPAGQHQITLQPATYYGGTGPVERHTVPIGNGRNTYVLANFPDARLVGKILTNQP